jgi:hypothetical protein
VDYVNPWDFIMVPLLLGIIYIRSKSRQEREIEENEAYRYYTKAIMFKVMMGLALAAVYAFYYGGGDTINYWESAGNLTLLFGVNSSCFFDIMSGNLSLSNYLCFTLDTGRPMYYLKDPQSFMIPRLVTLPYMLTVKSFFGCTVLISWIAFGGIWRLYAVFAKEYPRLLKEMAFCVLFIPSVAFWGSGILKDTFTFTAVCWMTYAVYNLLIARTNFFRNIIYLVVAAWILVTIKPYIFVALLPGTVIWVVFKRIQGVENPVIRILVAPILVMLGVVGASFIFAQTSSSLGDYGDMDTMLEKAVVTQQDLKQDYYGGNTFDIGDFDASVSGVLSKAPIAIFSGLFRPMLWEAGSVFMLVTAVENTVILVFFIYIFLKVGPINYLGGTFSEPMSMFGFVFALIFSFAVGLTTANFGSLVRYKIPAMPFFLASIYIARDRKHKLLEEEGGGTVDYRL